MPGIFLKGRGSIAPDQSRPTEGPEPSFFEGAGAAFRSAFDDSNRALDMRVFSEYQALQEALVDKGYDASEWKADWTDYLDLTRSETERLINTDKLWEVVQRERQRKRGAFGGLPATREEFEKSVMNRWGAAQADAQAAGNAGIAANLTGGMAAEAFNPINYFPLPMIGGGKGFVRVVLEQAIANAGIEVVQQPFIANARERRGEELSGDEIAMNIGTAAAFGGVLGGGAKIIGDNWGAIKALPKDAQKAGWGRIAPLLPEKMRGTMEWDAIPDEMLPDLTEKLVGVDNLTPDERTAIDVMRSDNDLRKRNPFDDDPTGQVAHSETVADMMRRILAEPSPAPQPARAARVTPSALSTGTALRTGTVDTGGRAMLKRRIGIVESGGSNAAANPNSSALGKYQFIKETFTRLYKSRYGSGGLSDAQIAAKRRDPRLQEILMDDLIDYNTRVLERAGSNGSAGDLYLAHFAGAETAARLLRADRHAPASSVFSPAAVAANGSILRGKSVGEVIAWAHRKMGSDAGPAPTARIEPAQVDDGIARLEAEIADIDRQLASQDAPSIAPGSADGVARTDDADALVPFDHSAELPLPRVPLDEAERAAGLSSVTLRMTSVDDLRAALQPTAPVEMFGAVIAPRQQLLQMVASPDPKAQAVVRAVLGDNRATALVEVAEQVRSADADALPERLAAVSVVDVAAIGQWDARFRQGMEIMQLRAISARSPDAAAALPQAEARWQAQAGTDLPPDLRGDMRDALQDFMLKEDIGLPPAAIRGAAGAPSRGDAGRADGYGVTDDAGPLAENAYRAFDDPDGMGKAMVADSLDHDMRVLAKTDDTGTAERLGLDAMFRLDTGDDPRSLAEVLEAIDEEQAAIAAVRECL